MRQKYSVVLSSFLLISTFAFLCIQLSIKSWQIAHFPVQQSTVVAGFSQAESRVIDELVPIPDATPVAWNFHCSGVVLLFVYQLIDLIFPLAVLFTGFHIWFNGTRLIKRSPKWVRLGLFVGVLVLLRSVVLFPLNLYSGFVRLHEYGLSNQHWWKWFNDLFVGNVLASGGIIFGAYVFYFLLRRSPKYWWLYGAALFLPMAFCFMILKPIWIDPLFNRFEKMENKALEADIRQLADKADLSSPSIFEVKKSVDTKAINAYVTGFLATKRIVLWDNAIQKLTREQLLFVVAHEMGHYVLNHILWTILLLYFSVLLIGFLVQLVSGAALKRWSGWLGFEKLSDPVSAPWLVLWFQIFAFLFSPVLLAYSRSNEHAADKFGLDLTHDGSAAASAFVVMQHENLQVPRPLPIYTFFFASHPSLADRIEFCNSYTRQFSKR